MAERIRARDPETLAGIVRELLPQVLRTARGAGLDADAAEEVAQETFRTFVEKASTFEGRSSPRTWLFGILYLKIREERRRRGRDARFDPLEPDALLESSFRPDGRWAAPPRLPDLDLERQELRRELTRCLETSPTAQRMAFQLREVEGLSTDEICDILDVTPANLSTMLHRLRHRTRTCLEGKGVLA